MINRGGGLFDSSKFESMGVVDNFYSLFLEGGWANKNVHYFGYKNFL